jgi:hypothetical protein
LCIFEIGSPELFAYGMCSEYTHYEKYPKYRECPINSCCIDELQLQDKTVGSLFSELLQFSVLEVQISQCMEKRKEKEITEQ